MFRVGLVDAALAQPAVGEFKANNDFMEKAQREHPGGIGSPVRQQF